MRQVYADFIQAKQVTGNGTHAFACRNTSQFTRTHKTKTKACKTHAAHQHLGGYYLIAIWFRLEPDAILSFCVAGTSTSWIFSGAVRVTSV